jgi:hypothetical protein
MSISGFEWLYSFMACGHQRKHKIYAMPVSHEADVNLKSPSENPIGAARGGHLEIVQSLIEAGAMVDTDEGETRP